MCNVLRWNKLSVSLLYFASLFLGIYDLLHRSMQSRTILSLPAKPLVSELRFVLFDLLWPLQLRLPLLHRCLLSKRNHA